MSWITFWKERLIISFPDIFCCKCFAEYYSFDEIFWCSDCRGRKSIEDLYEKLDSEIPFLYPGQIQLISIAIDRARVLDFFTASEYEVEKFWRDMQFLLEQDPALVGKILLEKFECLTMKVANARMKKDWAEQKTCDFIEHLQESVQAHVWTKEALERNAQPSHLYYYDLLELANGTHIPVPTIRPFWRKFFLKFAKKKVRNDSFFKCPFCPASSFFSQWTIVSNYLGGYAGCKNCGKFSLYDGYYVDMPTELKKTKTTREKKQQRKQFLLKTGLWIFFVRAYVKADKTKEKLSRERVERFLETGEV